MPIDSTYSQDTEGNVIVRQPTATATPPTCATCHFMRNTQCHRAPPEMVVAAGASRFSAWPPIRLDDWCGEYQSKGEFK